MKILFSLFLILLYAITNGQDSRIFLQLTLHDRNGPFEYENFPVRWGDTSIAFKNTYSPIKGIPAGLNDIQREIICFNYVQYVYQNFLKEKISKKDFLEIKKMVGTDFHEDRLTDHEVRCFVNIISGKNEQGEIMCLVDTNNDNDFSDELAFIPSDDSLSAAILNRSLKKVSCQRFLDGKVIDDTISLLITQYRSNVYFSIPQYATASLRVNNKDFLLAACSIYFHSRSWLATQLVLTTDLPDGRISSPDQIVNNGGYFQAGQHIYKFIGVNFTKNILSLEKVSSNDQFSAQPGFRAPIFTETDLITGKEVSLDLVKEKYVLIDFWGAWCQPCREQIPDLIQLNNQVDHERFTMISIATMDDTATLKKVITNENMNWPQLLSDSVTAQYNINTFPSNVLVNPKGIVIAKNLSVEDLKQRLNDHYLLR